MICYYVVEGVQERETRAKLRQLALHLQETGFLVRPAAGLYIAYGALGGALAGDPKKIHAILKFALDWPRDCAIIHNAKGKEIEVTQNPFPRLAE